MQARRHHNERRQTLFKGALTTPATATAMHNQAAAYAAYRTVGELACTCQAQKSYPISTFAEMHTAAFVLSEGLTWPMSYSTSRDGIRKSSTGDHW